MACHFHGSVFCHLLAWKLLSMGALSPRRRRCSSALQKDFRVLAAAFFEGVLLWLAVQSDPLPALLFAHFFWQDRKSGSAKQQLQFNCKRGSPVKPDRWADSVAHPYRLRRKNVCETMVGPRRKNKNTPVPVSRDESVCFVVPPLFRGQRPPSLRTDGAEAPAISAQRALYADSADVLRAPHRRSLTAKRLPL